MNRDEPKNLNEQIKLLQNLNVEIINQFADVEKLFEIDSLYTDKPIVHTEFDSILFFDTPNYNSNYLSDIIINYLETYKNIGYTKISDVFKFNNKNISDELNFSDEICLSIRFQTKVTKFYYCHDENIYAKLFEKYVLKRIGTNKQVPIMLTIKGNTIHSKEIFIDMENIGPLSDSNVIKNMLLLFDYEINLLTKK